MKSLARLNRSDIHLIMHKHWMAPSIPCPHFSRTHSAAFWKSTTCSVNIHHETELVYICEDEAKRTPVKKKSKDGSRFMKHGGPWHHYTATTSDYGEWKITCFILTVSLSFWNLSNFRRLNPLWEFPGTTKNNSTLDFLSPLIGILPLHAMTLFVSNSNVIELH